MIRPMPPTSRYPFVRWAVTRPDGYGRPVARYCHALHVERDLDPAPAALSTVKLGPGRPAWWPTFRPAAPQAV